MEDPYLYSGTEVLINLFGENDSDVLALIEADYTALRLKELAECPMKGDFDVAHLFKMHGYIFQDIYEWAGQQRKINIEKPEDALGGSSIEYSDVFDILKECIMILNSLNNEEWEKLDNKHKAESISKYMAELWKIHPFREGNTRTTITFICDFAEAKDFMLDRDLFKDNAEYVRTALVAASAIFKDKGDLRKDEYIKRIVLDALERGSVVDMVV